MKFKSLTIVIISAVLLALAGCNVADKTKLVKLGNDYFDKGKFREAQIAYAQAIKKDGRYGEAYYRLALTDLKLGRIAQAVGDLRRTVELQPDNVDAHSKLGDLYLAIYLANPKKNATQLGDLQDLSKTLLARDPRSFEGLRMRGYAAIASLEWKEAIDSFQAANEVKPDQIDVLLTLAQALDRDGQGAEADRIANDLIAKHKTNPGAYAFLYSKRMQNKQPEEARKVLQQQIANNPKAIGYRFQLATHDLRARNIPAVRENLGEVGSDKVNFPDGRTSVGDYYMRLGFAADALDEYQKALKENPTDPLAVERRVAEALGLTGKTKEATARVEELLKQHPKDAQLQALRGSLRLQSTDPKEIDTAVGELQTVIKDIPSNAVVRYNYADALARKGEVNQAIVQLEEAIKLQPNYVRARLGLGRLLLSRGDFSKAAEQAEVVARIDPQSIPAILLHATAMMSLQDRPRARGEVLHALQIKPNQPDALYLKGRLDLADKRYPEAEQAMQALRSASPNDPRGLFGLVDVYLAMKRGDAGLQLIEAELQKYPKAPVLRAARASVNSALGRYDAAIAEYNQLLSEASNSEDILMRLAETYRRAEKFDLAYQSFDKVRKVNPNNLHAYLGIAQVYQQTGRESEMRGIYEQILKISPDNGIALNNLAYLLSENPSELDQALTYAQQAKRLMPTSPDVDDTLGWIYLKKNLNDDAIRIFQDLLANQPGYVSKLVSWRYHLAEALFQKGYKGEAKRELQTALKGNPTKDELRNIQDLLGRIG